MGLSVGEVAGLPNGGGVLHESPCEKVAPAQTGKGLCSYEAHPSVDDVVAMMLAMSGAPASAVGILACYNPATGQPRAVYADDVHYYHKSVRGFYGCRGLDAIR